VNLPRVVAALRELADGLEAEIQAAGPVAGLLTVAQVAEQMHRSPSTVRGWCEAGRFREAFKLNGKDWRIPTAALETFLTGQRMPSPQDDPGVTISTRADSRPRPRRARKGDRVDLGAWRGGTTVPRVGSA